MTRRSLRDDREHSALTEALGWMDAAFEGDPQDVRTWPTLDPLAPHACAAVGHAEAEPLMRRALAMCLTSLGGEHPNTQIAQDNYSGLLEDLGQRSAED